ncbi:hypothetical protein HMN09_00372700 [Mycena chlorophos]|uniref:Uncharacterized protein n=1 Tax=Mycena chlorophos TaxID=658473 RepID=A0A8H6WIX6_MYCCL|nr:hypothetical protein HMN09_00372700 [Mycena chlorophos]
MRRPSSTSKASLTLTRTKTQYLARSDLEMRLSSSSERGLMRWHLLAPAASSMPILDSSQRQRPTTWTFRVLRMPHHPVDSDTTPYRVGSPAR